MLGAGPNRFQIGGLIGMQATVFEQRRGPERAR
jgi:hypothetical protein